MQKFKFNLQLFAEGGDGASSEGSGDSTSTGEALPFGIPDRARGAYDEAVKKMASKQSMETTVEQPTETATKPTKVSYADLIESDDYKEEHNAYMKKAIGDRLKKYKGVEAENAKMKTMLMDVANKYGTDVNDANFLDNLGKAISEDDSYYEKYAIEHDLSPTDARKVVTLERRIAEQDRMKAEAEQKAQMEANFNALRTNAEKTKALYPNFNLDAAMQDERFMRMCFVTNGDTTAAYRATHFDEITSGMVSRATEEARNMTAQAVKSNQNRPVEAGLSSHASANITTDFRNMSLEDIQAYAAEQRRLAQGR